MDVVFKQKDITLQEDTTLKVDETFKDIELPMLQKHVFYNCIFCHVTFRQELHNIQFINCAINGCRFDTLKIDNCIFINNVFKNTLFVNNNIYNTTFYQCTIGYFSAFYSINFKKSKFMRTSFDKATLDIYTSKNDKIFDKGCDFFRVNFISSIENAPFEIGVTSGYGKETILRENIIGYKKCQNEHIVTLEIPAGAVIFSHNGKKCRTNKVKVLKIETIFGEEVKRAYSINSGMSYYVGDEITVHDFDLRYNIECSTGIHFFMTKKEAQNYFL